MVEFSRKSQAVFLAIFCLWLWPSPVQSEIIWSQINISYLASSNYLQVFGEHQGEEVGGTTLSLEHAGIYNWGKSYFFVDRFLSDQPDIIIDDTYLEFSADFSISWITQSTLSTQIIQDWYIATTWENANPLNADNLLLGAGIRWIIPGFIFFDTNLYYRMQDDLDIGTENNYQLTTAWAHPFILFDLSWRFDGFFDWRTGFDNDFGHVASDFHMQPQLKMDVGKLWKNKETFYIGVEWDYWKNKFGIRGQTQSAWQLMLQLYF